MTAPVGGNSQTFDEIEAATGGKGTPPKLEDIKVPDGAEVPDEYKGKSLAEIIALAKGAGDSLRMSEQRRTELEEQTRAAAAADAARLAAAGGGAPAEPKEEPELTDEQLEELYQKKPMQAIAYMQARAAKQIEGNINRRLSGLVTGGMSAAETAARAKYPDEFALFGSQIDATIKALPNKEAMAQPQAWEDLIAYIRGKSGNFDKLMDHRTTKAKQVEAQAAQAAAAGPATQSATRTSAASPTKGAEGLDALELEIASKMGMTPADYAKWKRVA